MSTPELIVAGYVLARPTPRPPHLPSLPEMILTLSDCIMDTLPHPEFWDWFPSHSDAVTALASAPPDSLVITVALEAADAAVFIEELGGPDMPFLELLGTQTPVRGKVLGYELVGAEATLDFHSWHCYGIAELLSGSHDFRCADHGLIDSYADARRILDWMLDLPADEAVPPVPWFVVGLAIDTPHL